MKRYLFLAVTLLNHLVAATFFSDAERTVAAKYPATFKGVEEFEGIPPLDSLRGQLYGQDRRLGGIFLERILRYAKGINSFDIKPIIQETMEKLESVAATGDEALLFPLRLLAAACPAPLSEEEVVLFKNIPGSKILFALFRTLPDGGYAWQGSYEDIQKFIADPETPGKEGDFLGFCNLPLSGHLFWPMVDVDKIGLSLLVKAMLDGISILPMPYASDKLEAHGIKVLPIVLTFHDFLHVTSDPTSKRVSEWISKNRTPEEAQIILHSNVIGRRTQCRSYLKEVYDRAISSFDLAHRAKYNQVMVPLYMILHEVYAFKGEFLDLDLSTKRPFLEATVALAKEKTLKKLSQPTVSENATDDEIIDGVLQEYIDRGIIVGTPQFSERVVQPNIMAAGVSLKFTTTNTVVYDDGGSTTTIGFHEINTSIPTELNMERELGDQVPLLKICELLGGIDVSKPLLPQRSLIVDAMGQLFDIFLQRALA